MMPRTLNVCEKSLYGPVVIWAVGGRFKVHSNYCVVKIIAGSDPHSAALALAIPRVNPLLNLPPF